MRQTTISLVLLGIAFWGGCSGTTGSKSNPSTPSTPSTPGATSVSIAPATANIRAGDSFSIHRKRFGQFQHIGYVGRERHCRRFIGDRNNIIERQLHSPFVAPES